METQDSITNRSLAGTDNVRYCKKTTVNKEKKAGYRIQRPGPALTPSIFWIITCLILICCLLLDRPGTLEAWDSRNIIFAGYDALAHKGEKVQLKVKLEKKYTHKDIEDEQVSFYVKGKLIGKKATNDDGEAEISFTPGELGNMEITYKLSDSSQYTPGKTTGLLAVRTDDRPILVSDLDNTVIDIRKIQFLDHDPNEIPPLKNAPQVLKKLQNKYDIIYLTARNDNMLGATKEWLAYYKAPQAPVFFSEGIEDMLDKGKYKEQWLKNLKKNWPSLAIGIGDKKSDADAYLASGMKSYILHDDDEVIPSDATMVENWDEIYSILNKKPSPEGSGK